MNCLTSAIERRNIVNLLNLIAHRYDRVQPHTLCNIIETVQPCLLIKLESLLPPLPSAEELP
ncbi:hypothetical protein QUA41_29895 [Microcoleus sp. Pol11C1]|uniref:hypothetical protein n=1 Tax=unclassified Microcoleus TaxID=2642155 RepID=UPI002FD23E5E